MSEDVYCAEGSYWCEASQKCVPYVPTCPQGCHWDESVCACVPDLPPCPTGYHWDATADACVQDAKPTKWARTIGPLGVPSVLLHQLWRLRERYIRKEVHRKLHPLV